MPFEDDDRDDEVGGEPSPAFDKEDRDFDDFIGRVVVKGERPASAAEARALRFYREGRKDKPNA